jgi:ureidoacrylate peracid hydrolase
MEHIAFQGAGINELAGSAERLGIPIVRGPEPTEYGLSLYLEDPDGNTIEVFGPENGET